MSGDRCVTKYLMAGLRGVVGLHCWTSGRSRLSSAFCFLFAIRNTSLAVGEEGRKRCSCRKKALGMLHTLGTVIYSNVSWQYQHQANIHCSSIQFCQKHHADEPAKNDLNFGNNVLYVPLWGIELIQCPLKQLSLAFLVPT